MNIFYLDHDVKACAASHMDKHVVKMILEYSQLLSTAHRVLDGKQVVIKPEFIPELGDKQKRSKKIWKIDDDRNESLYQASHINHPSAVWVRESVSHYDWLLDLLMALHEEYTFRYEKLHKGFSLLAPFLIEPDNMKDNGFVPPPQAMPEQYKMDDTVEAYRSYYKFGKSHLAKWKKREPPIWYNVQTK
jgi:hypothetical protein